MNVVGTSYFDTWANYQVGYDIIETNALSGYHKLRLYGVLNVTGNNISWSSGTARVWDNTVGIGTWYGNGSYTLVTKDVYIYCDASGNFGATYIDGAISTSYKSGSCGGNAYLPHIDRFPVLNSGSNFTDKTNPVYNITAYNSYDLRVKIEAGGNTSLITRNLSSKGSQTYTLALTDEERKTLRRLSPNGKTLSVRETVCALQNGSEISWSYKDYTMTITKKTMKIRVNGVWKEATPYIRINDQWKEATPYIRINSQWKEGI